MNWTSFFVSVAAAAADRQLLSLMYAMGVERKNMLILMIIIIFFYIY